MSTVSPIKVTFRGFGGGTPAMNKKTLVHLKEFQDWYWEAPETECVKEEDIFLRFNWFLIAYHTPDVGMFDDNTGHFTSELKDAVSKRFSKISKRVEQPDGSVVYFGIKAG